MAALLGIQKEMLEELKHILEGFLANYEYQPSICFRLDTAIQKSGGSISIVSLKHAIRQVLPSTVDSPKLVDYLFTDAPNVKKREGGTLCSYWIEDSGLPLLKDFYLKEVMGLDDKELKAWLMGDDEVFDAFNLLVDSDGSLNDEGYNASDELTLELQTYSHRRAECIRHAITVVDNCIELLDCRISAKDAA